MSNQTSYNQIVQQWQEVRKLRPVDPLVVDFSRLFLKEDKILDIGCGTGYPIADYLLNQGFQVTGIDFSKEMIKEAKKLTETYPSSHFEWIDFFEFQTPTLFDGLVAFDVFFHFSKNQQREIYQRAASWLKPGGYLLFTHGMTEGEVQGEMFGAPFSYSALDGRELKIQLAKADFKIVNWQENYHNKVTGSRDLVVLVQKNK